MSHKKFTPKTHEQLKHYVYLYIDPRNNSVFYVGKGFKNRCYSHLSDSSETDKLARIDELEKIGLEPQIDILRHGLSSEQALEVESAAIDLLGLHNITNRVLGHGSSKKGRAGVDELSALLDAQPVDIDHPSILININQTFYHGMSLQDIYDATRCAWKINPERYDPKYAFAVYQGVVREVFEISCWIPGGSTMKYADKDGRAVLRDDRWEFVG